MPKDHTTGSSSVEENLLGLATTAEINLAEAEGVARAEESLLHYETDVVIDTYLILEIHRTAFEHLYEWAGKIRNKNLLVGDFAPPLTIGCLICWPNSVNNYDSCCVMSITRRS